MLLDENVHWKTAALRAAKASEALQMVVYSNDGAQVHPLPSPGKVTIGRGKESMVSIDDPAVSRHHAILHVGERLELEDLGSANGTFIRARVGSGAADANAQTLDVRQIRGGRVELFVGSQILFGTASVIVRHVPTVELPELDADGAPGVVIRDSAMRTLHAQAVLAARSLISVLILGETGVGKEVLARAIHAHSRRANGPFLAVSCANFTETLQESELFGFEKGAFSGATQSRPGYFEAAHGGTLFLDELGELPSSTQAKLLRALGERQVMRIGARVARPIDVRLVAATNRDVEAESRTGKFRADLLFRLNGISLVIPPLRERPSEIEPLARTFLAGAAGEIERDRPPRLSDEVCRLLRHHHWPGNVRELRNVIERAVVLCEGDTILPEHLPRSLGNPVARAVAPAQSERERILEALERNAGNQTRAARELGMSRRTLVARLDQFQIARPRKVERSPAS